ncbi:HPr-rel-A system PqqD family peptide chaperone [Sphingorhabdus pulchriflava]|uniref:HPr-rel-A system PqqD family peptide chaperone n=1 Tax=Sphingorhabdus pulchriflava TaxID=2292257 RepID=UPI001EF0245D|nr:HPr-rel-A system PqqD family peptide chaperone [Sphingorhabdus pulchriflava]
MANSETLYLAEPADARIVEPLDMMTLIYQRRSGITHLVGEPVPQMLEAMGSDAVSVAMLASRLAASFELGGQDDAVALITERLEELAELGLVERSSNA